MKVPVDGQGGTFAIAVPAGARYETAQRLFVGAAPAIRELSPARAGAAPGARLAIRGTQFSAEASRVAVTVGGRPAPVVSAAPGEVVVTVPADAQTGRVAITANGIGPVESATDFMVLVPVTVAHFKPRRRRGQPRDPHRHRLLDHPRREPGDPQRAARHRGVGHAHRARRRCPLAPVRGSGTWP